MIGLLQCDHVADRFRSVSGDYDAMFREWLPGEWRAYDITALESPACIDECDAYVTTGSRASVYDDQPWIHFLADLVRRIDSADIPFLGMCFGHQMMAHALGGRVARSSKGWAVGVHEFSVTTRESWMDPPLETFSVLMSCQDQVEELPRDAVVLASNAHCPVGLFRIRNMLGLQGHPEFPPAYAEALLKHRAAIIGKERVDAALATLARPVNRSELSSWASRFLFDR
jgi:GMP synthase-like glutamine amidotransferase